MLDDALFDSVDEASTRLGGSWFRDALQALREYVSQIGDSEFTSAEFRRWAAYYCNLDDPHMPQPWTYVFTAAHKEGFIAPVGRMKSRSGSTTGQRMRWMAA